MNKKLYDYKLNKVNPFISDTFSHVQKGDKLIFVGNQRADKLIDGYTGEVKGHGLIAKRTKVDKAQFAKIYVNSMSSWFQLSKTAIKIFSYILNILKPNADKFILTYDDCMEYTGYKTRKSIADGLRELIENKFIARGMNQYIYFINPTIFFNGNRLTLLQQYELVESEELKPLEESTEEKVFSDDF